MVQIWIGLLHNYFFKSVGNLLDHSDEDRGLKPPSHHCSLNPYLPPLHACCYLSYWIKSRHRHILCCMSCVAWLLKCVYNLQFLCSLTANLLSLEGGPRALTKGTGSAPAQKGRFPQTTSMFAFQTLPVFVQYILGHKKADMLNLVLAWHIGNSPAVWAVHHPSCQESFAY